MIPGQNGLTAEKMTHVYPQLALAILLPESLM